MNLNDLGSASASASVTTAVPDPAAAISQGSALFDQAYTKAGGSITGTVAVAASIVSDLPAGQAKQLLTTVLGLASGAAAGAAMGSVVPGWGTAVGAAVGAVMGLASGLFSSAPPPPEGDYRSAAEQMCFPPVPGVTPTDSDASSLIGEMYAQPVSWADIRIHSPGYQPPFTGTDAATGQTCPVEFSFGTGWVSPPQSTPTSKEAAWYLAQAWLGKGTINKYFSLSAAFNGPGDLSDRHQAVDAATEQAGTLLGSDALVKKALAYVDRWYGTSFGSSGHPWAFNTSHCAGVNTNWGWTDTKKLSFTAMAANWQKMAQCLNKWNSLDYVYYFSENLTLNVNNPQLGATTVEAIPVDKTIAWAFGGTFFAAMPDTTLVALCELAALVVLGVVPEAGIDHVALHFIMALAWLWRRGQEKDKSLGRPFAIANHENFSRVIGLLAHHVKTTPATAPKKTTSSSSKATKPSTTKSKSSAAPHSAAAAVLANRAALAHAAPVAFQATLTPAGAPPSMLVLPPRTEWTRTIVEMLLVTVVAGGVLVWTRRR